jgi:tRNA (cytidine/uridine-2'-O-)-methyltransferase
VIHVLLYEPEIPSNTGNIIRLCANTGAQLHLIKPLGFALEDKKLKRAGLDYHEWARMQIWEDLEACLEYLSGQGLSVQQVFPMTTKGKAAPFSVNLNQDVAFLMGPETRGLPAAVRQRFPEQNWICLPMTAHSRSLNLSNATAVIVYEAWRQQGFVAL